MFEIGQRVLLPDDPWKDLGYYTGIILCSLDEKRVGVRIDGFQSYSDAPGQPDFHYVNISSLTLYFEPNDPLIDTLFLDIP